MKAGSLSIFFSSCAVSVGVFCICGLVLENSKIDLLDQILIALTFSIVCCLLFFIIFDYLVSKEEKKQ